jgi:hypothetical protein
MVIAADLASWAAVAGAGLAAIAAAASWASVRQARRIFLANQMPDLELTILENLDTHQIKIHVENHGGGAARRTRFCVVEGDNAAYGFLPPTTILRGGEGRTLRTPMVGVADRSAMGVVLCHDAAGRVRAWSVGGEEKRWSLFWPWNRRLSDEKVFQRFYPGVDPFQRTMVRYEVEQ